MKRSHTLAVFYSLVSILTLSSTAWSSDQIVIKYSHVTPEAAPKARASVYFKELAEKYTGGKVRIEIYPNSQLYKDKEELEALQLGAVHMLSPSLSKFGPLGVKEFEAFDLPFLFKDLNAVHKITQGSIGKKLLQKLEVKGITGLAFWDNGFKIVSANKEIKKPDDLLGLKMRIQSSKVLEAQMKAWGAIPQVMAYSEVYQALQTGVVDGTENPPTNMFTQKMHEVQKYAAVTDHGYLGFAIIVNKKFWDGLPADIKTQLEKAMSESTLYANDIAKKENDMFLDEIKKSGKTQMHILTEEERQAWVTASQPVYDEMAGRVGKDLIEEIKAAVK